MSKAVLIRFTPCAIGASIGAIILSIGIALNGIDNFDIIIIGAVTLHVSLARMCIRPALRPQEDLYKVGYELGRDQGYNEGRRANRLTVVPIRREGAQAN